MELSNPWTDGWRLAPLALTMLLPLCDGPASANANAGGLTDPVNHIEPGLLEAVAIGRIGDAGKGLTKLPVSGVDEAGRHE